MPYKLNYGYYLQVSFKNNVDPCSKSYSAHEPAKKLRKLINICQQNLLHTQKPQKKAYNKGVKPWSYILRKKV